MEKEFEPKILAFLCNWCSYAGADLAGVSRMQYPPNIRAIRVMCSGRVNPLYVLRAFQNGIDGVLVAGCHPGECHYQHGNLYAKRRLALTRKLLEFVGIEPERLFVAWVSASEGKKFADIAKKMVNDLKKLGPINQELRRIEEW
ncbi:MAG: hydrogenase iron-sulfur subunit [Candidatus Thermoplasmatota archaeon]|nr:hydrogenase iron-sulfur subunit [Candidatus Thermoplasmatota archaeon]